MLAGIDDVDASSTAWLACSERSVGSSESLRSSRAVCVDAAATMTRQLLVYATAKAPLNAEQKAFVI